MNLFGVLNDRFEFLTKFSFNKLLKRNFAMVNFYRPGTSSHFNLVMSLHVAYLFSSKSAHAFCSFNKRLIRYCRTSIDKLLQKSSLENINISVSCFRTGNDAYRCNFFSIDSDDCNLLITSEYVYQVENVCQVQFQLISILGLYLFFFKQGRRSRLKTGAFERSEKNKAR